MSFMKENNGEAIKKEQSESWVTEGYAILVCEELAAQNK